MFCGQRHAKTRRYCLSINFNRHYSIKSFLILYYVFCVKQHIFVEYLILKWFWLQFGRAHGILT